SGGHGVNSWNHSRAVDARGTADASASAAASATGDDDGDVSADASQRSFVASGVGESHDHCLIYVDRLGGGALVPSAVGVCLPDCVGEFAALSGSDRAITSTSVIAIAPKMSPPVG
ncbi:MAG: hypothetical protein FWD57_16075, partial [Polyangiaceae bacterium]|nr:hypothetical protein [Polyangiaceae bacterium]